MLAGPLLSRVGGARSMPPNPAQKVPPVAHRVAPGPHSRDVNSCPREREGGYKPIPPDLPGGYRPPGRLLLQLQRLSSVAGFRLTPKGRCVCMYVCAYVCTYVVVVVVVVVSHIQRIGCQPEKTTLHGGQSRSWSAEQRKENKRKSLAAYPPTPPPTLLVRRK